MRSREEITLEPDPVFTDRYEIERERVREASGGGLFGVFHVGSTAVPDLAGKPALDVLAVFDDRASLHDAAAALADGTYEFEHDGGDVAVLTRWYEDYAAFVKLHVRDDEKVRNQLLFREYLRENADARREYERVKRDAAEEHPGDPEAYTRAKTEVVRSLLERAQEAGHEERLPEFA